MFTSRDQIQPIARLPQLHGGEVVGFLPTLASKYSARVGRVKSYNRFPKTVIWKILIMGIKVCLPYAQITKFK